MITLNKSFTPSELIDNLNSNFDELVNSEGGSSDPETDHIYTSEKPTLALKTDLEDAVNGIRNDVLSASSATYAATIAYVDKQIKTFDTLQLYINSADISTTMPTLIGTSVPLELTITEQLRF